MADLAAFGRIPPCADPRFDHRTCDYWEDADRGTKAARAGWLAAPPPSGPRRRPELADNPFAPPIKSVGGANPFATAFGSDDSADSDVLGDENPFAPTARERPLREGVPRKLALLDRGRGIFGSYARMLLINDEPVAYAQFGPLSAYPRAVRLRELYQQLPRAPLPAVITCIATTAQARRQGHGRRLVENVCLELSDRGFAAVEAFPDLTHGEDETSAGQPSFWHACGFRTAVTDERFPVMRRELS